MLNVFNFLSYVIATAFTPGPNNLTSMSNAARLGLKKALPFNFGVITGFSIIAVVCAIFANVLSTIIPIIKFPMLILGAIYMLYLAYKTFMSSFAKNGKSEKSDSEASTNDENVEQNLFLQGVLLQFVNVKAYIYIMVSLEAYVVPVYVGNYKMIIFFALLLGVIGFISTLCWAAFGSVFKILFSKYAKITNTIMALLLVYCAVSLFL